MISDKPLVTIRFHTQRRREEFLRWSRILIEKGKNGANYNFFIIYTVYIGLYKK